MDKKTRKIALILVLAAIIIAAVFVIIEKTASFEQRLKKEMEYEEILLKLDEYALVRIDENSAAFICSPGANKNVLGWDKAFSVYAEFELGSHSLVEEYYMSKSLGPYFNEFAEYARREHYAYSIFKDVKRGVPKYNFYMGISSTEPDYGSTGTGTEQLQYVELNGLYYFMFQEDSSIYY